MCLSCQPLGQSPGYRFYPKILDKVVYTKMKAFLDINTSCSEWMPSSRKAFIRALSCTETFGSFGSFCVTIDYFTSDTLFLVLSCSCFICCHWVLFLKKRMASHLSYMRMTIKSTSFKAELSRSWAVLIPSGDGWPWISSVLMNKSLSLGFLNLAMKMDSNLKFECCVDMEVPFNRDACQKSHPSFPGAT